MAFLTGLLGGTSEALAKQSANINRMREGMAQDRQLSAERAAVESRFSRTLAEQKASRLSREDYQNRSLKQLHDQFMMTHEKDIDQFDKTHTFREGVQAESIRQFNEREGRLRDQFTMTDKRERDFHRDTMMFQRRKQIDDVALTREQMTQQANIASRNLAVDIDRNSMMKEYYDSQREHNKAMMDWRNAQTAQQKAEAAQRAGQFQANLDYLYNKLYAETQLGYARLADTKPPSYGNLDSNIVTSVRGLGEKYTKRIIDDWNRFLFISDHIPSLTETFNRFESIGENIAQDVIAQVGGDKNEARRYVHQAVYGMFNNELRGIYSKKLDKILAHGTDPGPYRDKRRRLLINALYRGFNRAVGVDMSKRELPPELKELTEMEMMRKSNSWIDKQREFTKEKGIPWWERIARNMPMD